MTTVSEDRITMIVSRAVSINIAPPMVINAAFVGSARSMHALVPLHVVEVAVGNDEPD